MSKASRNPHDESDQYIKDFYTMITAPSKSVAMNGALQSPCNPHHSLFVMEGSHTLITQNATTRVEVLLDAEATLRNGQAAAYALEYNGSGGVVKMTTIDISAGSASFSCASVVSMRMDVSSASSINEVSGNITGSVLNTEPKNVHNLTATRLRQKTPTKHDQANCLLKDDGIALLALTTHMGYKPVSLNANSYPQSEHTFVEYKSSDDSSFSGFDRRGLELRMGQSSVSSADITPDQALANSNSIVDRLWDTANLNEVAESVFFLGTYGLEVEWQGDILIKQATPPGSGSIPEPEYLVFACVVLDYADEIMESKEVMVDLVPRKADNQTNSVHLNFEFTRQPRPIGRAFIYGVRSNFNSSMFVQPTQSNTAIGPEPRQRVRVKGKTNTGDLADRDLGIIIGEGMTAGSSLAIECCIVVSAIPSADRTFISGGPGDVFVDDSLIKSYLRTVLKGVPRAALHSEIGEISSVITHIMSIKDHSELFHAWSFGSIGRAFKSVANTVRSGVRGFDKVLSTVTPVMRDAGNIVSQYGKYVPIVGEEIATAGSLLKTGADVGDMVHDVTKYAYSGRNVYDARTGRMLKHANKMHAMDMY